MKQLVVVPDVTNQDLVFSVAKQRLAAVSLGAQQRQQYPNRPGNLVIRQSIPPNALDAIGDTIELTSTVFSNGVHTHTFEDTGDWLNEVYWARIFAGFHFNHSLQDGATLGKQVAEQLFRNHFGVERNTDRR
jgi:hypothetical protein